jgi:hypothetical protein
VVVVEIDIGRRIYATTKCMRPHFIIHPKNKKMMTLSVRRERNLCGFLIKPQEEDDIVGEKEKEIVWFLNQTQEEDDIVGEKEKEIVWFLNWTQEEDDIVGEKERNWCARAYLANMSSEVPTFG